MAVKRLNFEMNSDTQRAGNSIFYCDLSTLNKINYVPAICVCVRHIHVAQTSISINRMPLHPNRSQRCYGTGNQ